MASQLHCRAIHSADAVIKNNKGQAAAFVRGASKFRNYPQRLPVK